MIFRYGKTWLLNFYERTLFLDSMLVWFRLLRVKQWVKNTFLFIPIFFAGEFFITGKLVDLLFGFIAFSFVSSSVYVLNDLRDKEFDRIHPEKSSRPIASGEVSELKAIIALALLLLTGLAIAYTVHLVFLGILGMYLGLNVAYSMGLKRISIVDIIIVAVGFVLRTISGGIIADVFISQWLIIMIFLLSLFIVLAKRRDDIVEFNTSGKMLRHAVSKYNLEFINTILATLSSVTIVSYIMYTISPEVTEKFDNPYLYFTALFVMAGVMRYLQITLVESKSGSPTKILYNDRFLHLVLLGWLISFFAIIYLF